MAGGSWFVEEDAEKVVLRGRGGLGRLCRERYTPIMASGNVIALDYRTGNPVRLDWSNGVVTAFGPAALPPGNLPWLAPTLFDLQINGFAGVDFQQDALPLDALVHAARELRRHGCARWLLTLVTDAWPRLMARVRHSRHLCEEEPELARAVVGFHIEGPFLSAEPGFCGAHDAAAMMDPDPEHLPELRSAAGDLPILLTLAPERRGAIAAIRQARALGMTVSLGHSNATAGQLQEAIVAGAAGFTHLANGCPQLLDRHDNILWRVLAESRLTFSLIPDGLHVSPALFRLLHSLRPAPTVYYTTDAMSAAGMPPGRYRLGTHEVEVGADRIVRHPGRSNFAGSALTPLEGVWKASSLLGCGWREPWARFSDVPARFLGLGAAGAPGWQPGSGADFCLLHFGGENALSGVEVWVAGKASSGAVPVTAPRLPCAT